MVKNSNKRTFTPGKNSTFIDLNDLSPSTLWKLHYYVNFCLDNIKREKKLDELHNENESKRQEFEQKIQEELKKKLANGEIKTESDVLHDTKNRLYTFANLPSYETLRDQALYHANPISTEQIKITQMKQLNKQKELSDKDKKKNDFFHAYVGKKDTKVVKIPHTSENTEDKVDKTINSENSVIVHKVKIQPSVAEDIEIHEELVI